MPTDKERKCLVMPTGYSEAHGSAVSPCKLINPPAHLADADIPLRNRPACVPAKFRSESFQS